MRVRLALTTALASGVLLSAAGTASASELGPEWQPGPDYTNFQPGQDYTGFQPDPDLTPFQPGYAPGTADLVEDPLAGALRGLLGGLFRR